MTVKFATFSSWKFCFSESEILRSKEPSKSFFNCFAVLAADYISSNANQCKYFFLIAFLVMLLCNCCKVF